MKRASYREGVEWIALNDDAGAPDALDTEVVEGYISTKLLADLFGVEAVRVALDVCVYRRKHGNVESRLVIGQCAECFGINMHERDCSRRKS